MSVPGEVGAAGSGYVSSAPSGIDCGSTCTASYVSGTAVTLSTSAPSGTAFSGWSGACSGTATCTVTLSAPVSVTATFNTAVVSPTALFVSTFGIDSGTCVVESPCATISYAITQAAVSATITVATGTYVAANVTLDKNVIINGAGVGNDPASATIVQAASTQAGATTRVFDIPTAGTIVTITALVIENGNVSSDSGGGIRGLGGTTGGLTLNNVWVRNNAATGNGGGVYADNLTLVNVKVVSNTASLGGGLYANYNLAVSDSSVVANTSSSSGAGIHYASGGTGAATIQRSTIAENVATSGTGGLHVGGAYTASLTNSTISGNRGGTSSEGSQITNDGGGVDLLNVTVKDDSSNAHTFGAIRNQAATTFSLKNTVVGGHAFSEDCGFTPGSDFTSYGYNIFSDGSCGTQGPGVGLDHHGTDPLLGPLQHNGGYTSTHALLPGSPAIDAGDNTGCPTTDQRGTARPADGDADPLLVTCDVGAFELVVTLSAYAQAVRADSPVAYWRLGEAGGDDAADWSGNQHHGTYLGTAFNRSFTGAIPSDTDTSVEFLGGDGYVSLPSLSLPVSLTIELWVTYPDAAPTTPPQFIIARGPFETDWQLSLEYGNLIWASGTGCCDYQLITAAPATGTWHHVVVAQENDVVSIYIDGNLARTAIRQSVTDQNGPILIGAVDTGAPDHYFSGQLDEVAIYDTTLTLAQVRSHYTAAGYTAGPTTLYVATTGADTGLCLVSSSPCQTIGYAISQARDGYTINVAAGTYTVSSQIIVDKSVTIAGAGTGNSDASATIVQADVLPNTASHRVFDFTVDAGNVTLSGMVVQHGSVIDEDGGGIRSQVGPYGRAILDNVWLRLNETDSNGVSGGNGGGAFGDSFDLNNVKVIGNTAAGSGGGIAADYNLTLTDTSIIGNSASQAGGLWYDGLASGVGNLMRATIANNTATNDTGGIYVGGSYTLGVTNSTISANSAGDASGGSQITSDGSTTLFSSTVVGHVTSEGYSLDGGSSIYLQNTILSHGQYANCGSAFFTSLGYNLSSDSSCDDPLSVSTNDLTSTDPLLGPLDHYGGFTSTHALAGNSPAIDAGTPVVGASTDQRGFARNVDGNGDGTAAWDIGAYEIAANTLTVSKPGAGTGSITSADTSISCAATCTFQTLSYATGTSVALTAAPVTGSAFTAWGGACAAVTGTTCVVVLNTSLSVTAQFDAVTVNHQLTVAKTGDASSSGYVSSMPTGIDCGATCTASYVSGTAVMLTASPASGTIFAGWTDGCSGTVPTCTVTINSPTTVTAAFATVTPTFLLEVVKAGSGTGTVSSAPGGVDCGATCTATFTQGQSVTLTATPIYGSAFTGWSDGGCSGTATCTVTLSGPVSVTATFDHATGTVPLGATWNLANDYRHAPTSTSTNPNPDSYGNGDVWRFLSVPSSSLHDTSAYATMAHYTTDGYAAYGATGAKGWQVASGHDPMWFQNTAGVTLTTSFSAEVPANAIVTHPGSISGSSYFTHAAVLGWKSPVSGTISISGTLWDRAQPSSDGVAWYVDRNGAPLANGTVPGTSVHSSVTLAGGTNGSSLSAVQVAVGDVIYLIVDVNGDYANDTTQLDLTITYLGQPQALTVTKAGDGAGSGYVSSEPAGIDCGVTCSFTFTSGTAVTLTASAPTSTVFSGWSGASGCSTLPTCTVTLSAPVSVTATFDLVNTINPAALRFDGVDDYASVPNPGSSLSIGTQSWTVEAWVNTTYVTSNAMMIVNRYEGGWTAWNSFPDADPNAYYSLQLSAGVLDFTVRPSAGVFERVTGTVDLSDGAWHHVAGVLDRGAGLLRIFVDGAQAGTASFTGGPIADAGSSLEIGRLFNHLGASEFLFNGTIDEVRIWNTARTAAELAANKNSKLHGTESNLVGYWRFDEGTGTTVADSSGHGLALQLNNGPAWTQSAAPITAVATPTYQLTVARTGDAAASGYVSSEPSGIDCGTTCTFVYATGTAVSLTASAPTSTVFSGWSGASGCSTTPTCTVTMDAPVSVTATFMAAVTTTVLYVSTSGTDTSNNCQDSGNPCATLSRAVDQAQDTYVISVASGTYSGANGSAIVTKTLSIVGTGADTILDGATTGRVLRVDSGAVASVSNLTIANGYVGSVGGGGILNEGTLVLNYVTVTGASTAAGISGGGIRNTGILTITNSSISGNSTQLDGGGLLLAAGSTATISNTTFSGNSAVGTGAGGGIFLSDTTASLYLSDSVVTGNSAGGSGANGGGGVFSNGVVTMNRVIVTNNSAPNGIGGGLTFSTGASASLTDVDVSNNTANGVGGIMLSHSGNSSSLDRVLIANNSASSSYAGGLMVNGGSYATVTNVTLSGNSSPSGAKNLNNNAGTTSLTNVTVYVSSTAVLPSVVNSGAMTVQNTIFANGGSGTNCGSTIASPVNSLASDTTCFSAGGGNQAGIDPLLGTLADNTGFTKTHALQSGSGAIDAGEITGCPPTDQRGVTRPVNSICDIGAYEYP